MNILQHILLESQHSSSCHVKNQLTWLYIELNCTEITAFSYWMQFIVKSVTVFASKQTESLLTIRTGRDNDRMQHTFVMLIVSSLALIFTLQHTIQYIKQLTVAWVHNCVSNGAMLSINWGLLGSSPTGCSSSRLFVSMTSYISKCLFYLLWGTSSIMFVILHSENENVQSWQIILYVYSREEIYWSFSGIFLYDLQFKKTPMDLCATHSLASVSYTLLQALLQATLSFDPVNPPILWQYINDSKLQK